MSFEEFDAVWMLEKIRKRRKMENFELQSLRNVVKEGGVNVVSNFEKKFKEIKIEGKRKSHTSTMYTKQLPATHYTEAEHKEIEALYMGTESESRKDSKGTDPLVNKEDSLKMKYRDPFQEIDSVNQGTNSIKI